MEKIHYFTKEGSDRCKHLCKFMNIYESDSQIYIGSKWCGNECSHSFGYDTVKQTVKCELYSVFIERDKLSKKVIALKKENEHLQIQVEQLENENASLKGGL